MKDVVVNDVLIVHGLNRGLDYEFLWWSSCLLLIYCLTVKTVGWISISLVGCLLFLILFPTVKTVGWVMNFFGGDVICFNFFPPRLKPWAGYAFLWWGSPLFLIYYPTVKTVGWVINFSGGAAVCN